MRKTIVCIFAHPDDESFGPGGTLAKLSKTNDVYIISVTKGEAGKNYHKDHETPLQELRTTEMKEAAAILGVKKVYFLNYVDGTLSNSLYHKVAESITPYLKKLKPHLLLTFEPRGISGHIDHVFVAMVTAYLFEKLSFVKEVYYYCLSEAQRKAYSHKYFIYRPPGYKKGDISKTFDTTNVWEQKVAAMHKHQSQIHDVRRLLRVMKKRPKEENFIILKK